MLFSEQLLNPVIFSLFLMQSTLSSPLQGRGTNTTISMHIDVVYTLLEPLFEEDLLQLNSIDILIFQFVPATTYNVF